MAQSVLLPAGAPFGAEQISALNSVFSTSTDEQRAWLSGFLAGVQAANAPAQLAPAAPPKARAPLTILFGTEIRQRRGAGHARAQIGGKTWLRSEARGHGRYDAGTCLAEVSNLLLIASTWGEGDPPQRAVDFYEAIMADDAPRFGKTRFAVLALGDRAYAQFCEVGRHIDERLRRIGGDPYPVDRIDCRFWISEMPAGAWIDAALDRISQTAKPGRRRRHLGHPCRFRPPR